MSYADRLNNFNNAISSANEHIQNIKQTLSNKETRENPVRLGLELSEQVLGTGEGLTRVISGMKEGDVMRNVQNAFYHKLNDLKSGIAASNNNFANATSEALKDASGKVRQSLASTNADGGLAKMTQSVQKIATGQATNPQTAVKQHPTDFDKFLVDNKVDNNIRAYPQSQDSVAEANSINRSINQKVNKVLSPDEREDFNDQFRGTVGDINDIIGMDAGPEKDRAMKNYLEAKNNIANDVIVRKQQNLAPATRYSDDGQPIRTTQNIAPNANAPASAATASADAKGGASVGSNASKTVAQASSNNANAVQSIPDPTGNASNLSSATRVETDLDDIQDLGQAGRATLADGSNIVARGQALNLVKSLVPSQAGGTVQGLALQGNAAQAAHNVSQAVANNAAQHANALADGGQSIAQQAGARANQAASAAKNAIADAQSSGGRAQSILSGVTKASANADESSVVGKAGGLAKAMGVEDTLDALAPETGMLAPVLEAGSLLATLGTGLASLFEKPETEKVTEKPAPAPEISVGASLKNDAGGSVGAF